MSLKKKPEEEPGCIGRRARGWAWADSPYLPESRKGTSTTPPFFGHLLLAAENSRKGL